MDVEYVGASSQVLSPLNYGYLRINNINGVTLASGNASVSADLILDTGIVTTGANQIILSLPQAYAIASGAAWVNGNLQLGFDTTNYAKTFAIGDASNYTPIDLNFNGLSQLPVL